jgi:hypothetical protein
MSCLFNLRDVSQDLFLVHSAAWILFNIYHVVDIMTRYGSGYRFFSEFLNYDVSPIVNGVRSHCANLLSQIKGTMG